MDAVQIALGDGHFAVIDAEHFESPLRHTSPISDFVWTGRICDVSWGVGNVNTPRARRVELVRLGLVKSAGERDGSTVWRLA